MGRLEAELRDLVRRWRMRTERIQAHAEAVQKQFNRGLDAAYFQGEAEAFRRATAELQELLREHEA